MLALSNSRTFRKQNYHTGRVIKTAFESNKVVNGVITLDDLADVSICVTGCIWNTDHKTEVQQTIATIYFELTHFTREKYMSQEITHAQFFGHIAKMCGLGPFDEKFINRVKIALKNGDIHLNSIPLVEWDTKTFHFSQRTKAIISAFDNGYSLAGGVCMLKEKARLQAEQESVEQS